MQETSGNAFFLSELLDCLDPSSRQLRKIPLRDVIAQKLTNLPSEATELLTTVAVSGQSIGIGELLEACGCPSTGYAALTHMRNARLIRLIGDESTQIVDTYHDKIRETVLSTLGAGPRRSAHGRLARVIEGNSSDLNPQIADRILSGEDIEHPNLARVYDLAAHYDASGDSEKAALYALLAAEQAQRQFSPEVATRQYEIADRNGKNEVLGRCAFRLYSGYAASCLLIGKYTEAEAATDNLSQVAKNGIEMATYHELRGDTAFRHQRYADSIQHFSAALRELGVRVPRTSFGILADTSVAMVVRLSRSLFRSKTGKPAANSKQRVRLRVYSRMFMPGGFADGLVMGWTVLHGINFGEKFLPTRELGIQYSNYGCLCGILGLQKRAMNYVSRASKIQREFNDDFGVAYAANWSGIMGVATGGYARAEQALREAVERFGKVGEVWEMNMAQLHLGCVLMMQGRLDEALIEGHQAFVRAAKYGDTRTNCTLYLLTRASQGRLPMENYEPHVVHSEADILSTCNLHKAEGIVGLHRNEFDRSIDYFERSCTRPLEKKVPNFHAIAGLPFLVQSLRRQYLANPQNRKPLARAWRLARRGYWLCRFFPNELPFALREHGEVAWLLGRKKQALCSFDKSITIAAKQGANYDLGQTQLSRAKLRKEMNLVSNDLEIQAAEAEMQRFSQLIDDGLRKIDALKI